MLATLLNLIPLTPLTPGVAKQMGTGALTPAYTLLGLHRLQTTTPIIKRKVGIIPVPQPLVWGVRSWGHPEA